jgi:subtilisin family serine protease
VQKNADWGLDRVSAPSNGNYKYKYRGIGVRAYILDTGIRLTHIDFSGRASCGFTAYDDSCVDVFGHGTHVAGIVGGDYSGVAKDVNLIAVKILGDNGNGSLSGIFAGLDYVVNEKLKSPLTPMVINMSLGGSFSEAFNAVVANTILAGITVVVTAGNDADDACGFSPASATAAITVGSIAKANIVSSFSNTGSCVDIFAPGSDINSVNSESDDGFIQHSGTSMASPFVAGVAALHLEKTPALSPNQVWNAIYEDAYDGQIRSFENMGGAPNLLVGVKSLLKK